MTSNMNLDTLGKRIPATSLHDLETRKENTVSVSPEQNIEVIDDPRAWGPTKKLFHLVVPGCLVFTITFAASVTVPATPLISAAFNVSRTQALLVLTLYTLGIGLGSLFISPLSEVLGRKWIYSATAVCLVAFTAGAGAAQNFSALLACRFLAGFLGSASIAIGGGTIVDVFGITKKSGIAGLVYILGPFLGPTLAPLAGAYVLHDRDNDWRWTQWLVVILGGPIAIATLFMSETSRKRAAPVPPPPVLNSTSSTQVQTATPSSQTSDTTTTTTTSPPIAARPSSAVFVILRVSTTAIRLLLTDPIVSLLTIYTAYAYAMVFSFFSSASYVLTLYYGFDARQVGLSLLSPLIGYFLATVLFIAFDQTLYKRACVRAVREHGPNGTPDPEHRLYSAMAGSIFLPVGLFWYAWAAKPQGHWPTLVASGIPFGIGAFSLLVSSIQYIVNIYQSRLAASALAANGLLRFSVGAVFPLFTLPMYTSPTLGVHWAGSIFAIASLVLLPIPWILWRFGPVLRRRKNVNRESKLR